MYITFYVTLFKSRKHKIVEANFLFTETECIVIIRKKTDFVEALKRLESKPECQKLSLSSFLLLPMQRITRLPLLVGAVSNRMDPAHDKDSLDKAVRAYKAISKVNINTVDFVSVKKSVNVQNVLTYTLST
jgi:hypothetical protein